MPPHHHVAVIGAGVAVAATAVVTLLLREPVDEERRELARPTFVPPALPKTVEGGPVRDATRAELAQERIGTTLTPTTSGAWRPRGNVYTSGSKTLTLGQPIVTAVVASDEPGSLDKAIVRRFIRRQIKEVQLCYEKELGVKPALAGTVATSFEINPAGFVDHARATGVDPLVSSCIENVIAGIQFPRPKGLGGVRVTHAFTFKPS